MDGSSSRDVVQYKCACQIWYDLMTYDVGPCWLSPNNPTSSHLEESFLMDFTMARKKREGIIHKKLFFSTKFSHPKKRFINHLRTMEEVTFRILLDYIGYNHWESFSAHNLWVLSTSLHKSGGQFVTTIF